MNEINGRSHRRIDDVLTGGIVFVVGLVVGVLSTLASTAGSFASMKTTVDEHGTQLAEVRGDIKQIQTQLSTILVELTKKRVP